jgi:hypothetical protein
MGKKALRKRKRRETKNKAVKRKERAKNVKKREDQDTSTEGRKRRKRGGKARKKAAKQQSTRSSSPSSSSSSESSESKQQSTKKVARSSSPSSSSSSSSFSSSESWSSVEQSYVEKKQRPVVRQESGAQESETHVMIRDISTDFRQIQQGLHDHIYELQNQLQELKRHFYELNRQMDEKIDWLVSQQNNNNELFNCHASIGGGSSVINFDEDEKEHEHDNSRDGSKVGKTTEIFKNRRGPQLRSTPKRSTDQDNTTQKPPAKSQSKKKGDQVQYYTSFTDRQRGEPAAVNVGANAGLVNSNVSCYSNAILQCLASCIRFSDFSPSVNHPEFPLNHAFASLMISMMVGGEQIINPSSFTDVFMPLFRPQVGEVNADEQEGMYYDFA